VYVVPLHGAFFFEEHLLEPLYDVQWALGWMLVEVFRQQSKEGEGDVDEDDKQVPEAKVPSGHVAAAKKAMRSRGTSWVVRPPPDQSDAETATAGDVLMITNGASAADGPGDGDDEDMMENISNSSRLMQFFSLLPRLPWKHATPMLSLAVESIAESGLWRRAVLLPQMVNGHARWLRGFSWPKLFCFVHEKLSPEMRFRLWRASLQICVADPALAPYAEIPFALNSVVKDAPPGAAQLLHEAVVLGADAAALSPLLSRISNKAAPPTQASLLLGRDEAVQEERERRALLKDLGVDIDAWVPPSMEAPDAVPPHHRMRAKAKAKGGKRGAGSENVAPIVPPEDSAVDMQVPEAKRRRVCGKTKDGESEGVRLPLQEMR